MAWTSKTRNGMGGKQEILAGAATGTSYSSVIDFLKPKGDGKNRYVALSVLASAITGTDIDIFLYGSLDSAGTVKTVLLDCLDMSQGTAVSGVKIFDLEAYPYPYYFISQTVQASEAANTLTVNITPEVL